MHEHHPHAPRHVDQGGQQVTTNNDIPQIFGEDAQDDAILSPGWPDDAADAARADAARADAARADAARADAARADAARAGAPFDGAAYCFAEADEADGVGEAYGADE